MKAEANRWSLAWQVEEQHQSHPLARGGDCKSQHKKEVRKKKESR